MGKTLDQLNLTDEPLTTRTTPSTPSPSDAQSDWYLFAREIDDLLEGGTVEWATDTLEGIKKSVEARRTVTDGQRQAVRNIARKGKVERGDRRGRRYEGYARGGF